MLVIVAYYTGSMLLPPYYSQNYAGIIGSSLYLHVYFFPVTFHSGHKMRPATSIWDKHLVVENSYIVYYQWC